MCLSRVIVVVFASVVVQLPFVAFGQDGRLGNPSHDVGEPDALDQLLRRLALEAMPEVYEDDDDWGKTKEFVVGLHVARDGLEIKTHRRRRPLNHGSWERYRIALADVEQFTLDVRDVQATDDGKTAFTVEISAPVKAHARRARWRRGVQMWSISADADATVHLKLTGTLALRLDTTAGAPAVVLRPEVTAAEIRMTQFQLQGISKVRGEVADELGDALRGYLKDKVASKDEKLVRKINERIEKKQDRLRLSLPEIAGSPLRRLVAEPSDVGD